MGDTRKKLTPADYVTSVWSGGATTQLAIAPEGASYADRAFLWRISSATVELEESDFTALPDYHRLIATLRGDMVLTHKVGAPVTLHPYPVHGFEGAEATHSRGRCPDFNLRLRRGDRLRGNGEDGASGRGEPVSPTGRHRCPEADRPGRGDDLPDVADLNSPDKYVSNTPLHRSGVFCCHMGKGKMFHRDTGPGDHFPARFRWVKSYSSSVARAILVTEKSQSSG